jgi:hypothetical protein
VAIPPQRIGAAFNGDPAAMSRGHAVFLLDVDEAATGKSALIDDPRSIHS